MDTPIYDAKETNVIADHSGDPLSITLNHTRKRVVRVQNTWRIDDEWWREEVSRRYCELQLENGSIVTVFRDLVSGKWYRQRY